MRGADGTEFTEIFLPKATTVVISVNNNRNLRPTCVSCLQQILNANRNPELWGPGKTSLLHATISFTDGDYTRCVRVEAWTLALATSWVGREFQDARSLFPSVSHWNSVTCSEKLIVQRTEWLSVVGVAPACKIPFLLLDSNWLSVSVI